MPQCFFAPWWHSSWNKGMSLLISLNRCLPWARVFVQWHSSPPVPRRGTLQHWYCHHLRLLHTAYEEGLGASNIYSLGPTQAMPANSLALCDQKMDVKGTWRTVWFYTRDAPHLVCSFSVLHHVNTRQRPPICLTSHHFSVRTHSYYSGLMAIIFQVISWPVWQA